MDSIQLSTLAALAGKWQAEADCGAGSADRRAALRECADTVRMLCEVRFEDCPHAAPHRYCAECPVSPCPIALGEHAVAKRGAVPEGWKPMPINGSYDLARAFRDAETAALLSGHDHIEAFHCGYRAMLAAGPAPACTAPAPADDASLSTCQARLFDVLVGDDGQAWAEAERYLETARPDLFATLRREPKPAKCDGNHGGPRCADPECWNDGPIALILDELRRAVTKFPTWPTDPLHALAVLGEEYGELTKATLQTTYEPHKSSHDDVRTEAIQTAAMALRFVISLERYEYTPGIQHQQEGQPA